MSYPDIHSLQNLAKILGISVDELMQTKNEINKQVKVTEVVGKTIPLAMVGFIYS